MTADDKNRLRRAGISVVTLLIVILAGVWLVKSAEKAGYEDKPPVTVTSVQTSLEGSFSCLPHKNTDGPVTLECAYGIKTSEGYYALDTGSLTMDEVFSIETAERFRVTGTLVPLIAISSNYWQKYDVLGIMRVETFEKLE